MKKTDSFVSNYVVYGSHDMVMTPNFVHFERIENSRLKNRGEVKAHVHSNIFQFIYISQGDIEFESKYDKFRVKASSCIVIPENNLHSVKFNKQTKGTVITVSQLLFYSLFEYNYEVPDSFQIISVFQNQNKDNFLNQLIKKLERQLLNMKEPHEVTVRSILILIIRELYHQLKYDDIEIAKKVKVNDSHLTHFMRLIRKSSGANVQLHDYATEMGITTTHLNRICKETVGKTASAVIKDYIILEAKRYLSFTSHSISEIAYLLEFSTPSYFNRYFKKSVGKTPKDYRNRLTAQGEEY